MNGQARDSALDRFDARLERVENFAVVTLTLIALGMGTMQVVMRYVFNFGFPWTEGIFVFLTVWGMMIAGSVAVKRWIHVRVDLILILVNKKYRRFVVLLNLTFPMLLSALYIYCGILYINFVWMIDSVSVETGVKDWIIYLIVPISMTAFAVRYLMLLVRLVRGEDISPPTVDADQPS